MLLLQEQDVLWLWEKMLGALWDEMVGDENA